MTARVTEAAIEEALAALPPTPDEVAGLFKELGITGQRGEACHCPVANYLAVEFPAAHRLVAFVRATVVMPAETIEEAAWAPMPAHLIEFINRFDDLHYPALITAGLDAA